MKIESNLSGIDKLYRPRWYWVENITDKNGVNGWVLTVFHGSPLNMYSSSWECTDYELMKPLIDYLEANKVEKQA